MKHGIIWLFCAAWAAVAPSVSALEISLEENRGETGSVGYVDIEKVFKLYPRTVKAKAEFASELAGREKELLDKKQELFVLKAEVARMKEERAFGARFPMAVDTSSTTMAVAAVASTSAVSGKLYPDPNDPYQPNPAGTLPAASDNRTTPLIGDAQIAGQPPVKTEMDKAIEAKEKLIRDRESQLRDFQGKSEHDLLDIEKKKTNLILARIYKTLQQLAIEENISVVVDKKGILFGQTSVDLTDKLIYRLRTGD